MRTFRAILLLVAVTALRSDLYAQDASTLLTQLMRVWDSGDVSLLDSIVDTNAIYDDIPNHHTFEGLDGFKQYVGHVHSWASDITMEVHLSIGDQNHAYAEWTMTGIQSSPIPGRVPEATNRPFSIRGLTLVESEPGKITRAADYLDVLGFVIQLGSKVELPGGVVIQGKE